MYYAHEHSSRVIMINTKNIESITYDTYGSTYRLKIFMISGMITELVFVSKVKRLEAVKELTRLHEGLEF